METPTSDAVVLELEESTSLDHGQLRYPRAARAVSIAIITTACVNFSLGTVSSQFNSRAYQCVSIGYGDMGLNAMFATTGILGIVLLKSDGQDRSLLHTTCKVMGVLSALGSATMLLMRALCLSIHQMQFNQECLDELPSMKPSKHEPQAMSVTTTSISTTSTTAAYPDFNDDHTWPLPPVCTETSVLPTIVVGVIFAAVTCALSVAFPVLMDTCSCECRSSVAVRPGFDHTKTLVVGCLHLGMFVSAMVVGIAANFETTGPFGKRSVFSYLEVGVWTGFIYIFPGVLGITASRIRNNCNIISFFVMTLLAFPVAVTGIALSASYVTFLPNVTTGFLLVISLLEVVVCVTSFVLLGRAMCCQPQNDDTELLGHDGD